MKSIAAFLLSFLLLFPSVGINLVLDVCCKSEFRTCCEMECDLMLNCHSNSGKEECGDLVHIVIPPSQQDFTTEGSTQLPPQHITNYKHVLHVMHNPFKEEKGYAESPIFIPPKPPSFLQVFRC